jgi:hypothetical protein
MSETTNPTFSKEFWESFNSLGIYSKEEGPLLADQNDASVTGGKNSSDDSENSSESKEQNNDMNLDSGLDTSDMGSDDLDLGMDDENIDDDGSDDLGGTDSTSGSSEPVNPNENPFKDDNGKSLLDAKLAELQAAINDTLQRVYANPKIETVVVSELENLQDSVRNIRETVFIMPDTEQIQYKYNMAAVTYAKLSESLIEVLREQQKNNL